MSKNEPKSEPLGSRTQRPHAPEGWHKSMRDDDNRDSYDPAVAKHHRDIHKK